MVGAGGASGPGGPPGSALSVEDLLWDKSQQLAAAVARIEELKAKVCGVVVMG